MADKNFFNLLKDKMASLQPAEQHREVDWLALGDRLDAALPPAHRRRRVTVLPLLLLVALLSSNAVWWQSGRNDRTELVRLGAEVAGLRAGHPSLLAPIAQVVVRTDTVWRTVYVQTALRQAGTGLRLDVLQNEALLQLSTNSTANNHGTYRLDSKATERTDTMRVVEGPGRQEVSMSNTNDLGTRLTALSCLAMRQVAPPELHKQEVALPQILVVPPLKAEITTKPFSQTLLTALRPKFFKVGGHVGWLFASSTELIHEGGFSYYLGGQIGLSRHWSVTAAYGLGQVHYKAHDPAAILGSPGLPVPGYGQYLTEMDVTGQRVRQFDLGVRYTFRSPGQPRPFVGIHWGQQTLLPFIIEYEVQDELTGSTQKGVFEITTRTRLRNVLGLSAGLDLPLSSRFDLTLEGNYHRQWKKPSKAAADLIGIHAGVNWLF